jgi:hypothetical protein
VQGRHDGDQCDSGNMAVVTCRGECDSGDSERQTLPTKLGWAANFVNHFR